MLIHPAKVISYIIAGPVTCGITWLALLVEYLWMKHELKKEARVKNEGIPQPDSIYDPNQELA